ncbi:hypothetical protein AK812_SmicGene45915, partial [Symbiodinium microadriaticum]
MATISYVLPDLLAAQKFPGQEAAQVLPAILKISVKLKEEELLSGWNLKTILHSA